VALHANALGSLRNMVHHNTIMFPGGLIPEEQAMARLEGWQARVTGAPLTGLTADAGL
jgi:hypothetical protein